MARCGIASHSVSVMNGMTGWSRRRYASRASTSVHQVASRSAAGSDSSARRTLASSRPQSQYSFQIASYSSRVTSPKLKSAIALSTAAVVAATRDSSHWSAGPRWPASGSRRSASSAIDAGRAPITKRVAFHSLLAKLRAFSTFAVPNRWSWPGVVPWTSANRSASAPSSSIVASGSTVLPFVFDILAPYGSRIRPDR